MVTVHQLQPSDRPWAIRFLTQEAGSLRVVSRGLLQQADTLPGLVAIADGDFSGLLTYRVDKPDLEVVTLHVRPQRKGIGSALLEAAVAVAREAGCRRLWVITTNDNQPAIDFYMKRGMKLVAIHKDALTESRRIKPEIPLVGVGGVPITDEWEFERLLRSSRCLTTH
jgi:ribosomal protein S18 acetylase RimI-like enzyme